MTNDLSTMLGEHLKRALPNKGNPNETISNTGHDCRLPVFAGFPVSLDPRTGERASTSLLVHCTTCGTYWGVVKRRGYGADLLWVQRRSRPWQAKQAVDFDAARYYAKPDPASIDWNQRPRPKKPNGLSWYQLEFPELLGEGENRCTSTHRSGHGKIGEPTVWTTHQCMLKTGHSGMHESTSEYTVMIGWS